MEVILAKCGELVLKGLNRRNFEAALVKNIRRRLESLGDFEVSIAQSTIYVEPCSQGADMDSAYMILVKVFGIVAVSRATVAEKDIDKIFLEVCRYLGDELSVASSFKVNARRSDKKFPLTSPELGAVLGEKILGKFSGLTVNLHDPNVVVNVEIRERGAYIHSGSQRGAGGVPVGTSGRAMVLLSGGIDSPVSAYMMAKRGLSLSFVHFASPPYTSERAREKVVLLAKLLSPYVGAHRLYIVPFTALQEALHDSCKSEYFTVIMRRYMLKIASELAVRERAEALITGESIAQVASQTLQALVCTDATVDMPIFRPLIGMDKEEIVKISRLIGTFDTSTMPYEDCCTVFAPRHPCTKPKLVDIERIEQAMSLPCNLVEDCIKNVEIIDIPICFG